MHTSTAVFGRKQVVGETFADEGNAGNKRAGYKERFSVQPLVLQCSYRFVDRSAGQTLTTHAAMELARGEDAIVRDKLTAKQEKEANIETCAG